MKRLPSNQTKILFSFVKRFYSCKSNPKIAVLLLNQAEWKTIWLLGREAKSPKQHKKLRKYMDQLIQHFRENPEEIEDLPERKQFLVRQMLSPHFAPEVIFDLNEYMNESMGDHYPVKRIKSWLKYTKKPVPEIFQPFMNYDHVILISYFMNKEQWRNIKGDRRLFRMMICQTIFHEMIHVIEEETKTEIFKIGTKKEDIEITTPILETFLRQYETFFWTILEI